MLNHVENMANSGGNNLYLSTANKEKSGKKAINGLQSQNDFVCLLLPNSGQQITKNISNTADNRAGSCVLSLRADHCLATKGGSSFLYTYATNFCTQMPNSEKVSAGARSVSNATHAERKPAIPISIRRQISRLETSLKTERDAKNHAYCFILSHGLYEDYVSFSKQTEGMDSHVLCLLVADFIK